MKALLRKNKKKNEEWNFNINSRRFLILPIFTIIAITFIMATILFWLGRTPFCECGKVRLWSSNVNSNENSQQFFDPYTFTHITHGVLLYYLTSAAFPNFQPVWKTVLAIAVESGWEVTENTSFIINRYRKTNISLGYYGDSIFNSVGDVLANILGILIALKFKRLISLLIVVLLEIFLVFWIKDSLLLNIIMLIYPFQFINKWQSGI